MFYKYPVAHNRTGRKYSWLTNEQYFTEAALREKLAIRHDWGIKITKISEFKVPRGTWVNDGLAKAQGNEYPGMGYQAVISDIPKNWITKTSGVPR